MNETKAKQHFLRIPDGHANPLQRHPDKHVDRTFRGLVESANKSGDCIINVGSGYYRPLPGDAVDEKELNEYLAKVLQEIYSQFGRLRITQPVRMKYAWYEPNTRRDLDNISSFGRKVIQDALVKSKVLQNDGWDNIKGFSDEFYVDTKNPRIEILIEEE